MVGVHITSLRNIDAAWKTLPPCRLHGICQQGSAIVGGRRHRLAMRLHLHFHVHTIHIRTYVPAVHTMTYHVIYWVFLDFERDRAAQALACLSDLVCHNEDWQI